MADENNPYQYTYGGTQLAHRGIIAGMGRPDFKPSDRPDFANRPRPEGFEMPAPNGEMKPPQGDWQPPERFEAPAGMGPGGFGNSFDSNAEQSVEFTINSNSRVYNGIAPLLSNN